MDRALQIMSLFDDERNSLTLRDVLAKTRLPKTTAIRLMQTLEHNGMLHASGNGEFVGGLSLLRWARLAARTWTIPVEAARILASVAATCGETVNVYVRRDIHRVCIAQHEGPQTLRHVVRVGDQLPLWAGGAAKILLLDASTELLESVAEASPDGPSHLAQLREWVEGARKDGYATSRAEREVGLASIAVPVRSRAGAILAALSLGGPSDRFTEERLPDMVHELARGAEALEAGGFFEHLPAYRP
ncbi:MAG: IclR family transcriptional regulator [Gaiellaceae bacterium]